MTDEQIKQEAEKYSDEPIRQIHFFDGAKWMQSQLNPTVEKLNDEEIIRLSEEYSDNENYQISYFDGFKAAHLQIEKVNKLKELINEYQNDINNDVVWTRTIKLIEKLNKIIEES